MNWEALLWLRVLKICSFIRLEGSLAIRLRGGMFCYWTESYALLFNWKYSLLLDWEYALLFDQKEAFLIGVGRFFAKGPRVGSALLILSGYFAIWQKDAIGLRGCFASGLRGCFVIELRGCSAIELRGCSAVEVRGCSAIDLNDALLWNWGATAWQIYGSIHLQRKQNLTSRSINSCSKGKMSL